MLASFFSAAAAVLTRTSRSISAPRNATYETRTLTLDSLEGWDDVIDGSTSAGVNVSHDMALSCAPVWQAWSMISSDTAGMPLNCYKRGQNDTRSVDDDHPAQHLVSVKANRETSALEFWQRIVGHAVLWGNGYGYISRKEGQLFELLNLLPDRTAPARLADGTLFYVTHVDNGDGRWARKGLRQEQVFHLKGPSTENAFGADLIAYARDAIGLALAAERFNARFFAGGCQASGILEIPPTVLLTPKAESNIVEGFRKRTTDDEQFKVAILRDGVKFQQLTINPENSQTHELREDQVRDIARFFNMPPSMLGVPGSVSYNSHEQSRLSYLQSTLWPWMLRIKAESGLKFLSEDEQKTHYFGHNTSKFVEPDAKTTMELIKMGIEMTVFSPNDGRRKLDEPPREGGDVYGNPNTSSPKGAPPEPKQLPAPKPTEEEMRAHVRAVLADYLPLLKGADGRDGKNAETPLVEPIVAKVVLPLSDLRPILADQVNRMAKRMTTDARANAKPEKRAKFQETVDSKAEDYRKAFDDLLRATAGVIGALKNEKPEAVLGAAHGMFFAAFLEGMTATLDKPLSELAANVDAACKAFEDGIAATICDAVLQGGGEPAKWRVTEYAYNDLGLLAKKREPIE